MRGSSPAVSLAATAQVGVAIALAPLIPAPGRSWALLFSLVVWVVGIAAGGRLVAGALWREAGSDPRSRLPLYVGGAGLGLGALAAAQLVLVRSLPSHRGITWNVDWRYALTHAQAIARTGGVDRALDYAGVPVDYHVGPAWLAGAVQQLLGSGLELVLFGVVPLLSFVAIALACIHLLRQAGLSLPLSVAATGVVLWLPKLGSILPYSSHLLVLRSPGILFDPEVWLLTSLALNSLLGLAVGLGSLGLVLGPRAGVPQLVLGAAGLASTVQIKPQYFAGLGLFVGLLAVVLVLRPQAAHRGSRVLAASAGALGLALALKAVLPGVEHAFLLPAWAPGGSAYLRSHLAHEVLSAHGLVVVGALALCALRGRRPDWSHAPLFRAVMAAAVALALGCALFYTLRFPVHPEMVARAVSLGLGDPTPGAQWNLAQSLLPLRLLAALAGAGLLVSMAVESGTRASRGALGIGWGVILAPVACVSLAFADPFTRPEATADAELEQVLRQVPRGSELVIASDLADQAQRYKRPARGVLLTAYRGHQFYLSNLQNVHMVREDAPRRLSELRVFFGSRWTEWHTRWLADTGITHVLVNSRCVPVWWRDDVHLRVIAREGRWTALVVARRGGEGAGEAAEPPWVDLRPEYGRAACLLPRTEPETKVVLGANVP